MISLSQIMSMVINARYLWGGLPNEIPLKRFAYLPSYPAGQVVDLAISRYSHLMFNSSFGAGWKNGKNVVQFLTGVGKLRAVTRTPSQSAPCDDQLKS